MGYKFHGHVFLMNIWKYNVQKYIIVLFVDCDVKPQTNNFSVISGSIHLTSLYVMLFNVTINCSGHVGMLFPFLLDFYPKIGFS